MFRMNFAFGPQDAKKVLSIAKGFQLPKATRRAMSIKPYGLDYGNSSSMSRHMRKTNDKKHSKRLTLLLRVECRNWRATDFSTAAQCNVVPFYTIATSTNTRNELTNKEGASGSSDKCGEWWCTEVTKSIINIASAERARSWVVRRK